MYSERSVELKSDFYKRYGETGGRLYFERTGTPCVLLQGKNEMLAVALKSGTRACGRKYGDVLKLLNIRSNVSDISFVKNGNGAQILYESDIAGLSKNNETEKYTIDKLLKRMGIGEKFNTAGSLSELCDRYGSGGWCAYCGCDKQISLPFPLGGYNIFIIKTQKNSRIYSDRISEETFAGNETRRILSAVEGLRACREEVLFDILNCSERDIEMLMSPSEQAVKAVRSAMESGACAARICELGIVCISNADKTDIVIHNTAEAFERAVGYSAGISVVY